MGFVEGSFRGVMGRSGQPAAGRGGKQKERKGRGALSAAALAGAWGRNSLVEAGQPASPHSAVRAPMCGAKVPL